MTVEVEPRPDVDNYFVARGFVDLCLVEFDFLIKN